MTTAGAPALSYSSAPGRWVLAITVLGSGIASLDATVVNVALPKPRRVRIATGVDDQWNFLLRQLLGHHGGDAEASGQLAPPRQRFAAQWPLARRLQEKSGQQP
jgi:hypothetical protein